MSDLLPTREGYADATDQGDRPGWQTGQLAGIGAVVEDVEGPVFTDETRRVAERIIAKYPTRRSALVPLLYLVQSEVGWVPRQGMREVATLIGLTTAEVEAVATFYTMLKLHPCGKFVLSICTNPSCALLGGRRLFDRAKEILGPGAELVTEDGLFTLEEEECLAACDKAPVVAVNYLFFDSVTDQQMEQMIAAIRDGTVPEASRGGVPGELKEISSSLAGVGSLRPTLDRVHASVGEDEGRRSTGDGAARGEPGGAAGA